MSDLVTIKVDGLAALQAQLLDLGAELGVKALARAARKAFQPVLWTARGLVPVDSGELRDAIRLTVKKPGTGDEVVIVGLRVGGGKKTSGTKELPPARRWHFIELGTAKLAAHPFFRPALDQNADGVMAVLKDELVKSIQRAVKKASRGR